MNALQKCNYLRFHGFTLALEGTQWQVLDRYEINGQPFQDWIAVDDITDVIAWVHRPHAAVEALARK